MKKINLKCGGFVYIEPFGEGEEDDRHKIYDEYMTYIDYIPCIYDEEFEHARYDKMVEFFKDCSDFINYLSIITNFGFVTADNPLDLMRKMLERVNDESEPLVEIYEEFLRYLQLNGEERACQHYGLCKIGRIYFYMEDGVL